jgi:hypothetical protein
VQATTTFAQSAFFFLKALWCSYNLLQMLLLLPFNENGEAINVAVLDSEVAS